MQTRKKYNTALLSPQISLFSIWIQCYGIFVSWPHSISVLLSLILISCRLKEDKRKRRGDHWLFDFPCGHRCQGHDRSRTFFLGKPEKICGIHIHIAFREKDTVKIGIFYDLNDRSATRNRVHWSSRFVIK